MDYDMKTQTIKTPTAELLVVEVPNGSYYEVFNHGIYIKDDAGEREFIEGYYTLLGTPDEIMEEDVKDLVKQSIHTVLFAHYVKGIPVNAYCYKTAKESLLSLLESEIDEQFDFKRSIIFKKNNPENLIR